MNFLSYGQTTFILQLTTIKPRVTDKKELRALFFFFIFKHKIFILASTMPERSVSLHFNCELFLSFGKKMGGFHDGSCFTGTCNERKPQLKMLILNWLYIIRCEKSLSMLVSYNRYINRSVPESGTDLFITRQDGLIWSQFYRYHTIGGTTTQGAGTTERWPSVTASSTHPTLMCRAVLGFRV